MHCSEWSDEILYGPALSTQMWAELFMENKENVLFELDYYLDSLKAYRDALAEDNMDKLVALLDEGKKRKEEVDG